MTADFKVYNVYLNENGEETRTFVGDIRDVQTFRVKDLGGLSAERLRKLSRGRFDGTITAFPDEKKEVPMPPNAPRFLNRVRLLQLLALSPYSIDHSSASVSSTSCALPCLIETLAILIRDLGSFVAYLAPKLGNLWQHAKQASH